MPLRPSTIVRGIPFFPIPQSVMPGICTHGDEIARDIPVFPIPQSVMLGICTHGDELRRVIVRKTRSHLSNARIRTRSIKREFMRMETPVGAPVPDRSGDNEGNRSGSNEKNRGGSKDGEDGERI